jgi:hypothetical protein
MTLFAAVKHQRATALAKVRALGDTLLHDVTRRGSPLL